jgi:long-chain acyl-CoA synthetase
MRHELQIFTLRHLLERSALRHKENVALTIIGDQESRLTYSQLLKKVNSMATYMLQHGLEKGDKIAILAESQVNWGLAFFAVISCGAVAVPILPDFSAFEINTILEHSEAKAIIVSAKQFDKIVPFCKKNENFLFRVEDLFHIPSPLASNLENAKDFVEAPGRDTLRTKANLKRIEERNQSEDDLATIIYTSGTTGSSKGVMLTNKNLTSNASACVRQFFKIKSKMRFLSILPLSHSYEFTIGFLLPLLCGCEIHYLGKPPAPSILLPALKSVRPHVMLSVPLLIEKIYRSSVVPQIAKNERLTKLYKRSVFRRFINSVIGKKLKETFGGRLKFFGVGGAALDIEVEKFLKEAKFPYAIGYGLTETSPLLAGSGPKQTKVGTVGPALKGVDLRIDYENKGDKEGEIVAFGPNVMVGYYKDEKLTAESFTADGYFKTGDLGIIEHRRLSIKGRSKTMILGPAGENIYPESIETLLNNRPYVLESLVLSDEGGLAAMIRLDLELMAENLKISAVDAKENATHYLSQLREEVNKELSSFSRIREVLLQKEPFQRTPTLKIKRYLYQIKKTFTKDKEENQD